MCVCVHSFLRIKISVGSAPNNVQVTDLISGQDRITDHMIPIFTHDIFYDIRPLECEAGVKNEFEVIAKRPDGKPVKMKDVIVTVTMMMGDEYGKKT